MIATQKIWIVPLEAEYCNKQYKIMIMVILVMLYIEVVVSAA